jgi:hypothetical protein
MISKYPGTCGQCDKPWYKGSSIARWEGSWVHSGCQAQARAEKSAAGQVTPLPGNVAAIERWPSRKQTTAHRRTAVIVR